MQENIPPPPQPHALSPLLTSILATQVQRTILPPLFDPANPPPEHNADSEGSSLSQSAAFNQALAPTTVKSLPPGGGPFKGFAHVMLRTKADVERMCEEWAWEKAAGGTQADSEGMEVDKAQEASEHERQSDEGSEKRQAAKKLGMRAIP